CDRLWAGSWGVELLDIRPRPFGNKDGIGDGQRFLACVAEPGVRRDVQGSFLPDHLSVDGIDKTHNLLCPYAQAENPRPSLLCAGPTPCRPEAASQGNGERSMTWLGAQLLLNLLAALIADEWNFA